MRVLREVLEEAGKRRVAVGHFNFSELVVLKAAAEAASELGVPVVMGVSESCLLYTSPSPRDRG